MVHPYPCLPACPQHGDVHAGNVMLAEDGCAVLCDLGEARVFGAGAAASAAPEGGSSSSSSSSGGA